MKKQFNQPPGLEPGIYLNFPDDKYHKDTALSHTDMVNELSGHLHYWIKGSLNPDRKDFVPSDAMKFGTYCHEMLLDEKKFFATYNCTSAKWDIKKKVINKTVFDKVKESIDEIKRVPKAYEMFQNGFAEVVIVLVDPETGIRVRCMIDWLRIFGGIDYKRARSIHNRDLGYHCSDFGYDIQEVHYTQMIKEAKRQLRAGTLKVKRYFKGQLIPATVLENEWFKRFAADERCMFRFLFQRSERPFIFTVKFMSPKICENAAVIIDHAKQLYKAAIIKWGAARPDAGTGEATEMSEYHMPLRSIDRGDHQLT